MRPAETEVNFDTTSGCTNTIRQNYSTDTSYQAAKPVEFLIPPSNVVGTDSDLTILTNKINLYKQCIQRDWTLKTEIASQLYDAQTDVKRARASVKNSKESVEEAKERANLLENPYSKTTWWETWFPLGRPMKKDNVPVLMGISVFFLIFALGLFLRLSAIELQFVPVGTVSSGNIGGRNLFARKSS